MGNKKEDIVNNISGVPVYNQIGDIAVDYAIVDKGYHSITEITNNGKVNKSSEKSIRGKKSRAAGQRFEAKARQEMEKMGWIVSKWMNTVDYDREGKIGKLVPAKRKFNPFMRAMTIGTGFPDFVCFKKVPTGTYEVIGLEVKGNGYLDQVEKGMCIWLLENKIFSRILIAKKGKKNGEIEYIDFNKKYYE